MHDRCPRCGLFHPAGTPCLALQLPGLPADGLRTGALLAGRYLIVRTIHRGGMSTVYLAEDALLHGREVALKELRPPADAEPAEVHEAEVWFAREAALLSRLRHPLIPAFYSVFREDGRSYIAQEYIEGENLEEVARDRGPLAPDQAVAWGLALCGLLEYLHTLPEPVIFRDLKPANVLLRSAWSAQDRRLAVVDFGIARPFQEGSVGTVIGTPGYAPPEQYQGLATPRSDVYALGATLHRLLSGRDPEHGAPFTFPPVRDLNPAVPQPLASVVERAVALNPADRFADASAFAAALRDAQARLAPAGAGSRGGRGRAGAWVAAALLLFPLVLSQAFRSVGNPAPISIYEATSMPSGPGPFIGAGDGGASCTARAAGQPGSTIACGPDGSIWLVDPTSSAAIDRIDVDGTVTSYALPDQYGSMQSITAGSDACQCLWLASNSGTLLRFAANDGDVTPFTLPAAALTQVAGTLGPDGALWLALLGRHDSIVRVAPDGTMRSFALQDGTAPSAITTGPDGNIWFAENRSLQGSPDCYIGRLARDGRVAEWRIPTPYSAPRGIVAGEDGALWFTEEYGNAIGRITTAGAISEFPLPSAGSQPKGIATAPDGSIWFAELRGDRLGRFDPPTRATPVIAEYALPPGSHPMDLAVDPYGRAWWAGEPVGAGAHAGVRGLDGTVQIIDTSQAMEVRSVVRAPQS